MAEPYGIIIRNAGVSASINSGNPIWLVSGRLTKQWKNINQTDPIPGKFGEAEARQGGSENPLLTIEGNIDIHDTAGTFTINDRTASVKITEDWLISLSALEQTSNSYLVLEAKYGTSGVAIRGRDTSSGYPSTTTDINVTIDSWDFDIPSDSHKNHMWSYTIIFHETKNVS